MEYRGYGITIDSLCSMLIITDKNGDETVAYYGEDISVSEVAHFAKHFIDGLIDSKIKNIKVIKGGKS